MAGRSFVLRPADPIVYVVINDTPVVIDSTPLVEG